MKIERLEIDSHKRYLLGGIDPETEELDSRLILGDPSLETQLGIAEDELIDEYVRGNLSSEDSGRFEQHFLLPERRRRKVAFTGTLHSYVTQHWDAEAKARSLKDSIPRKPRLDFRDRFSWLWDWSPAPAWSYAMAGLLVIALIGGSWAMSGKLRLEGQVDLLTADLERLEEQVSRSQQEAEEQAKVVELEDRIPYLADIDTRGIVSSTVATVWLSPGLLRGQGEVERLIIPAGSSLVRAQLDIGIDDYASYRAALNDANGDELWTQSKLTAATAGDTVAVTLTLPSELLPRGDYSIRLSGVSSSGDLELVGRYYFRVLKD